MAEGGDVFGDGAFDVEDRAAADQGISASGRALADVGRFDAAIDFDLCGVAAGVDEGADAGDFVELAGKHLLAAPAGVDRHDHHLVDVREGFLDGGNGRAGVDAHAGLEAAPVNAVQGAVDVGRDLDVDVDGLDEIGEGIDEAFGFDAHEVEVERERGDVAERLDERLPEGDGRDETAIHDIEVEEVDTGGFGGADFVGEAAEVRGEDGRSELY